MCGAIEDWSTHLAKKCLYEGIIVPTALYGAEAWGTRSRADQRVLRWFGHVTRMDEYSITRRVLMAEVRDGGYEGDRG